MRIMMIAPGTFPLAEMKAREDYAKSVCSPGTTLLLACVEGTCPPHTDQSRFSLLVPGILQRVNEAEMEGYDAVVIDCCTDVGLEAAKTTAAIPVVGPSESNFHIACLLADKFGWIIVDDEGISPYWRLAKTYGMADRITSMKALNIPPPEYRDRKDELEAKLTKLAQGMANNGAQLILLGCTAVFPTMGIGSALKLSRKLGIPVMDPIGIALRVAEMLASLNLSQSKASFPKAV